MCGIAGISSSKAIDEKILSIFLETLQHRGPDNRGTFLNADRLVGLAHTRLSILDLSEAGKQPMCNEDQTLWITYNGEVYNFQELREELAAKGHRFRSQTDTEVVLKLYEEEGSALVRRLNGMFAFAIYDQRRNSIFMARDRLGIKPLYYAQHHGTFLFASEIKAILATGQIPAEANWQALFDYFTYLFVPHTDTAFKNIQQLPPAHTFSLNLKTGQISQERYWSPWGGTSNRPYSSQDAQEQVAALLSDSVRCRLISDVPVGIFFSGGIDSTILAALMNQHAKTPVQTFTVTFEQDKNFQHDDLEYARLASRELGTKHHELLVDLQNMESLLEMIQVVDQPFGNPTLYLQYLIAKATREHVTVALSGVGGDELFGGYPKYRLLPFASTIRMLPQGIGRLGCNLLGLVREDTWVPVLRRAKRILKGAGLPLADQYLRWSYSMSDTEKRDLLRGPLEPGRFKPSVRIIQKAFAIPPAESGRYGQVYSAELETFLSDNLLEYTDKATMASALETRVPFLDHRLVELGAQIPFRDKIQGKRTKAILTDAFSDCLPEKVVRAPKRGFSPPIANWMNQVLDQYFVEVLSKNQVEKDGIFSWKAIEQLRQTHRSHRRDASMELLGIIMFDAWYRRTIVNG